MYREERFVCIDTLYTLCGVPASKSWSISTFVFQYIIIEVHDYDVKHVLQMHEMYVPALSENSFITNTSIMRSAYSVVLFQWGLLYAPWLRNDNKRKMKNLGVPIFHVLGSQSTSVPASLQSHFKCLCGCFQCYAICLLLAVPSVMHRGQSGTPTSGS